MKDTKSLPPVMQKFIFHWGEMGERWGVNRTVAQTHALLYLWPEPLSAQRIGELLSVAQSNVSNSLKELQSWRLAYKVPAPGERRDYFTTSKDLWALFKTVAEERKKRELDPTLSMLRECLLELKTPRSAEAQAAEKIKAMLDFLEGLDLLYTRTRDLTPDALGRLLKLGGAARSLAGLFGRRNAP